MKKAELTLASGALIGALVFFGQSVQAAGPDIDDITASTGKNSATVSWTTDVSSSCTLEYGTESGVYAARQSSNPGTEHSVYSGGLAETTTYYYRMSCTDGDGATTRSTERSFTTKTTTLAFTDVHVTALGSNAMVVEAVTNKNAHTTLYYGTSPDALTNTAAEANRFSPVGQTVHYHAIKNLKPETTYYFKVTAGQNSTFFDNPETAESVVENDTTRKQTKVTSIKPTKGGNGTKLTIKGQGFGGGHSSLNPELLTAVGVGCKLSKWPKTAPSCLARVLSWTDSKIVVRVGKNAKTGPVYIGKAYDIGFQFTPENIYTVKGPTFTKK
ncbi:MAG: fibronectin type III domain-containing protein [Candidatus Kerfeldbacteria bacterium]|nr:fibronectin type III domain-containing protein [Candidatus Kerfeldbacteria bacterium]